MILIFNYSVWFKIPGNEGKAGMAAIYDPENSLNLKELAEGLKKGLPSYARPLFIRVLSQLPLTGKYYFKNFFFFIHVFSM